MKVMQIDVNYKYSSTGKIVSELHQQLISHGHESYVLYGRGKKTKDTHVFKFGIDLETNIHAFLTRITGLTGIYSPFSTARLIRKIKKFKPDVVHIHELHAYFVNHAKVMKYLKKKEIPTVWTFHCEYMYTGKCGYANDCTKFMTECHHCPQLNEYPKTIALDFTRHMFRVKKKLFEGYQNLNLVTPSSWLKDRVNMSFLKDFNTQVIHNGIDTNNIFKMRNVDHLVDELKIDQENLILLSIAPNIMSNRKGGALVLKLAEKLIDFPVQFIMIGAESLDIEVPKNVILLGNMRDQTRIADFYNLADAMLLFSQKENFPTTAIESLSCGTPLLAFDTGGTRETAQEGFGTFIPYADIKQAEKLIRDHIITKKTDELKKSCSEIYRKLYSPETMYENYEKIYLKYDPKIQK